MQTFIAFAAAAFVLILVSFTPTADAQGVTDYATQKKMLEGQREDLEKSIAYVDSLLAKAKQGYLIGFDDNFGFIPIDRQELIEYALYSALTNGPGNDMYGVEGTASRNAGQLIARAVQRSQQSIALLRETRAEMVKEYDDAGHRLADLREVPPVTAGAGSGEFEMSSVSHPDSVRLNGPRGALTVGWSGTPAFPVTMVYAPDSCPPGIGCSTMRQTFDRPDNPLVFEGALWCAGNPKTPLFFDYSVYLVDANGVETAHQKAGMTCE